jgi:amino acid transporter
VLSSVGQADSHPRKASLLQLSFLIYGVTCAGAYGLESLVSGSGPGLALVILLILPFLWAYPISLATAELSAAFPIEGGYYRWSKIAFGEFWGFQAGWWSCVGNFANNGVFAVLFTDYLKAWGEEYAWLDPFTRGLYSPSLDSIFGGLAGFNHWVVCLALIWLLTYLNVRGIQVVGATAIVFNVLLLLPFVFLAVLGSLRLAHNPFSPFLAPGKELGLAFSSGIMVAIWLYSGWDKMSTAIEEVDNPQRNYPLALLICVPMVIATYVVPTALPLSALGNWQDWGELSFTGVAEMLGGIWLKHGMTIGALLSNAILLEVTILTASRLPFTMSQDGFLPGVFRVTHRRYGTPWVAIVAGSAICSVLALLPFQRLIDIYGWLQMTSYVLIFATLLGLRRSQAATARPFLLPGGRPGLLLATVTPTLLALAAMLYKLAPPGSGFDRTQLLIGAASLGSGPVAYAVYRLLRRPGAEPPDARAGLPGGSPR